MIILILSETKGYFSTYTYYVYNFLIIYYVHVFGEECQRLLPSGFCLHLEGAKEHLSTCKWRIIQFFYSSQSILFLSFFHITHTYKDSWLRKAIDQHSKYCSFLKSAWQMLQIMIRDVGSWTSIGETSLGFEACESPNRLIPRHWHCDPVTSPSLAFHPAGFHLHPEGAG